MWIDLITKDVATTYSEVRSLRPNWSAPSIMTDEMVLEAGFVLVDPNTPTYDPTRQDALVIGVELVDGVYKQKWLVTDWTQDRIDAANAAITATNQKEMAAYLVTVRSLRELLLNRISGIATAALSTSDSATVTAFLTARQRLLDITKVPAAVAATNKAELETAIKTEYAAIVGSTAPVLRTAFYQVEG